jgi:protease PrsW
MPQFYEQTLFLTLSFIVISFYYWRYRTAILYTRKIIFFFAAISFGFASVGFALALQLYLFKLNLNETNFVKAFLYSALVEELSKTIFIFLFLKLFKVDEFIYDGIFYGVVIGATFGFLENILYLQYFDFWPMVLRAITSGSIHLLNGGITGFYCLYFLFLKKSNRSDFILKGFLICLLIHATYNYSGFSGKEYLLFLPIILVLSFIFLEFLIAYSQTCLPKHTLNSIKLDLIQYEYIKKFIKYELWFYNQQKGNKNYIEIFREVERNRKLMVSFFCSVSIFFLMLLIFKSNLIKSIFINISPFEFISIFILYPFVISFSLLFKGLINPNFFQKKVLRVPFICLITIKSANYKEDSVLFYIAKKGFYVQLDNPKNLSTKVAMDFLIGNKKVKNIIGKVIWTNENKNRSQIGNSSLRFPTSGAIIEFERTPHKLIFIWKWKRFTHSMKNLYSSLKEKR